ncbi:hypothetical protein [Peptostreptococcus porci]|nr:hypothetical protein [Peptostreptococcus porci]
MEIVFEFLHSTLNKCGYNRDKRDSTVISGIYDATPFYLEHTVTIL